MSDSALPPEPPTQTESDPTRPNPSPTFPNPNPSAPSIAAPTPPPPSIQPSFRPATVPQFSPVPYQQAPPPGVVIGSAPYGQPLRYAAPPPNGYPGLPPQGALPPPGIPRYPSPYAPMIRTPFPPRPLIGVMPQIVHPPVVGIRGPIIPPIVRPPVIPNVAPAEKPQTTVYVGKISSTVENDFMLSLLQLCGPVKSWKRPQDPTGALKGFGFCEFESAEGVLRAMRLLSKLNVDGQELMVNVNQTTREYLVRYVEKKIEGSKNNKKPETGGGEKEDQSASDDVKETVKASEESPKTSLDDEQKKPDSEAENKVNPDSANFGLATDEDREADRESLEKLTSMLEERLRSNPLPPPPPLPPPQAAADGPSNSNSEQPSGSRDKESDGDIAKNDSEDKNEDDRTAESKPSSEHDKSEMASPDRSRRRDRSRDRDRDRDYELRREKERELERYVREREQERAKREKEREYKSREDERRYKSREKEWEARERDREHWRKREREREKERAQQRKWEIMDQERDNDDSYGKKRKYKVSDEERKRRQREKEEDLADRLREEEEIAEAKIKALEEQQLEQHEALSIASGQLVNGQEKDSLPQEIYHENQNNAAEQIDQKPTRGVYEGDGVSQNGISYEAVVSSSAATDARQNNNVPTKKLGFGLSGSGKRAAVPSVFNEDEDEDAHRDKKMRPLVPIDYSTEEQQAVQPSASEGPSANVLAAAEYAKRISTVNPKEEKPDIDKEKGRRSHDRSHHRERDRHEEETNSNREESKKDNFDKERVNKVKAPENFLDAKQLIDTIPKTKDELFSYAINWSVYDQNALHGRMRPWISKKIMDFLGEEEVTLVDYIVSSIQEHVDASEMLDRLQAILDDEAEMFVLKMWRMLIFEIKRVETGLAMRSRT